VPPLRERGKDILLLSGYLLEVNQKRLGVDGLRLTAEAKQALSAYDWPGNVRELEHMLSRSALKAIAEQGRHKRSIVIDANHLDISLQSAKSSVPANGSIPSSHANNVIQLHPLQGNLKDAIEDFQRRFVEAALERHQGNQAAAARELGVNRSNFYRLLKRLECSE